MIIVYTAHPNALLSSLRALIDDGKTHWWSYDDDGDFSMLINNDRMAYMRPRARDDRLVFSFLGSARHITTKQAYATYHTRLAQVLLEHLDESFDSLTITSDASESDMLTTMEKRKVELEP